MNYKVRFHLGRGENYKHWQISHYPDTLYLNPYQNNLILKECRLHNNRKIAEKIFAGENKTVCSWIFCKSVDFVLNSNFDKKKYKQIFYNPKTNPFWIDNEGNCLDNLTFIEIRSIGKNLYVLINE